MSRCTSEGQGQPLVEVLGVRFLHGGGGQAPAGTVSVFDGKRGQIIYSSGGRPVNKPSSIAAKQRSGGWLPLTGPYRAISADGCVAIVLDLHHRDTASSSPTTSCVDEILLDVYDEATRYDEAITSAVRSTCGAGRAEVTYALLSDAAEAIIEVKLPRPEAAVGLVVVGGRVVARTDVGEVVLFDDDAASVGTEEEPADAVPLARYVVAVQLTSSLTVEVDLVVRGGDGEAVVKESVVCVSKLGREEVHRRPTAGVGAVEVKVTWLD